MAEKPVAGSSEKYRSCGQCTVSDQVRMAGRGGSAGSAPLGTTSCNEFSHPSQEDAVVATTDASERHGRADRERPRCTFAAAMTSAASHAASARRSRLEPCGDGRMKRQADATAPGGGSHAQHGSECGSCCRGDRRAQKNHGAEYHSAAGHQADHAPPPAKTEQSDQRRHSGDGRHEQAWQPEHPGGRRAAKRHVHVQWVVERQHGRGRNERGSQDNQEAK